MIVGSLPNADKNNLIPTGDEVYGVTIEPLTETWSRFDFTFHAGEAPDDLPENLTVIAGLMERSGTAGPWGFTSADCALSVRWEREADPRTTSLFGTVTEIWETFGVEIVSARRTNVDVGYNRPGPRYTFLLAGSEYRGYVDYIPTGGSTPRCIVAGPVDGFPFPLRLALGIADSGSGFPPPAQIRDIMLGGRLGQKTILSSKNKTEWGVDSDHLHLRIYQNGIVNGFPVDIDL